MNDQFTELLVKVRQAKEWLEDAETAYRGASSARMTALNRLNDAQKAFDAFLDRAWRFGPELSCR